MKADIWVGIALAACLAAACKPKAESRRGASGSGAAGERRSADAGSASAGERRPADAGSASADAGSASAGDGSASAGAGSASAGDGSASAGAGSAGPTTDAGNAGPTTADAGNVAEVGPGTTDAGSAAPDAAAGTAWIAKLLPDDPDAQWLVTQLFAVMTLHKSKRPFPEGRGPGVDWLSLDLLPLGILHHTAGDKSDLLLVNWQGEVPKEFEAFDADGPAAGRKLYVVRGLATSALRSIDKDRDHFFSSLFGAQFFAGEEEAVPSGYLPPSHFLRAALGKSYIPLVVPYKRAWPEGKASRLGILNTIVHECSHIFENRQRMGLPAGAGALGPNPNDEKFKAALERPAFTRLLGAYEDAVERAARATDGRPLGKGLAGQKALGAALELVAALDRRLAKAYPEEWQTYLFYEYTEGLTEFAAAQTMLDAGLVTYAEQLKTEVEDFAELPMFYRTGAFGGLLMRQTVGNFTWQKGYGYDPKGIWQRLTGALPHAAAALPDREVDAFVKKVPALAARVAKLKARFP